MLAGIALGIAVWHPSSESEAEPSAELAQAAIEHQLSPHEQALALIEASPESVPSNPSLEWERALTLPPSSARLERLARLLSAQADEDFGIAKRWTEELPPTIERDFLLGSLVSRLAETAPETALTIIDKLRTSPFTLNRAHGPIEPLSKRASDIVRALGNDRPEVALEWVGRLGLDPSDAHPIIEAWHEHSPQVVEAWLSEAPSRLVPHSLRFRMTSLHE